MSMIIREEENRVAAYVEAGHPTHGGIAQYFVLAFLPILQALNRGRGGLVLVAVLAVLSVLAYFGARRSVAFRRALKVRAELGRDLDTLEARKLGTLVHVADPAGLKLDGLAARMPLDLIAWRDLRGLERDGAVLVARFDLAPAPPSDLSPARRAYRAEFDSAQSAERFRQLVLRRYMSPDPTTNFTPSQTPA